MTRLILKLAPKERLLINGAVIENGEKRTKISIRTPDVHVLRLKDAIHPNDVKTPVSQACYIAQLILSGDIERAKGHHELLETIHRLGLLFIDQDSKKTLEGVVELAAEGKYYHVIRKLRDLLPAEARMLGG